MSNSAAQLLKNVWKGNKTSSNNLWASHGSRQNHFFCPGALLSLRLECFPTSLHPAAPCPPLLWTETSLEKPFLATPGTLSAFFYHPFLCSLLFFFAYLSMCLFIIYHLSSQVGKSMGSQRVRHDWATERNWFQLSMCLSICPTIIYLCLSVYISVYIYLHVYHLSISVYMSISIYLYAYLSSIFICLSNYHLSTSIYLLSLSLYLPVSI